MNEFVVAGKGTWSGKVTYLQKTSLVCEENK